MKHANISIFIPHNGCPHQCSFCNQKSITGQCSQPTLGEVENILEQAKQDLKGRNIPTQIAFFGGSFTAIDRGYMTALLDTAFKYVQAGIFSGIRLSTRPDAIDNKILDILKSRGVTDIELGCQSTDDEVLQKNQRGHTCQDIINASHKIKSSGFNLGLQMMTGLYGSTIDKDIQTADKIISLKPNAVRIYPTVIMKNTRLAELYSTGEYKPYTFEQTVELCALLLRKFQKNNITVLRLGLHHSKELERDSIDGAYHPAFREICESKIIFDNIVDLLKENNITDSNIEIQANPKDISRVTGQKKCNILKLKDLGFNARVIQNESVPIGNPIILGIKK